MFRQMEQEQIDHLIIDLRYNTGGDERTGKQLLWYLGGNKNIQGFTDYTQISDYYRQTVKKDYKDYRKLYKKKYGQAIPNGEINISELKDETYFENIEKKESPYLLDYSIPKFKGVVYVIIGNQTFSGGQILATTISDNGLATIIGQPTGNKPTSQTIFSQMKLPHTKTRVQLSCVYMERPDASKNEMDALYPDIELHTTFEKWLEGRDVCFDYILEEIKQKKNNQ